MEGSEKDMRGRRERQKCGVDKAANVGMERKGKKEG